MKTERSKPIEFAGDSGVTLIDMAVFLVVIGLLAVPLVKQIDLWQITQASNVTDQSISIVEKAISDFYYNNNRYPCPSDINLPRTDPNYGKEDVTGICASTATSGGVKHGGVPFVDLLIPESASLDGYKNRLDYAVSDPLREEFDSDEGAITLNSMDMAPNRECRTTVNATSAPLTEVYYVIVSHGPNGVGSVPRDGGDRSDCPTLGSTREAVNCTANTTAFLDEYCAASDIRGATLYDDVVFERHAPHNRIWVNSAEPTSVKDIVTKEPKVGINTNNPFPVTRSPLGALVDPGPSGLDVVGNIRTEDDGVVDPDGNEGTVNADTMCDFNGANCFNPSDIGGAKPYMKCDEQPGTGMTGIIASRATCTNNTYNSGAARTCPAGQSVTGFDSAGVAICM